MRHAYRIFFILAFSAGIWFSLLWYVDMPAWLGVTLLVLPWVIIFGLWTRLLDEHEIKKCQCAPEPSRLEVCGTCKRYSKCKDEIGVTYSEPRCEAWGQND